MFNDEEQVNHRGSREQDYQINSDEEIEEVEELKSSDKSQDMLFKSTKVDFSDYYGKTENPLHVEQRSNTSEVIFPKNS